MLTRAALTSALFLATLSPLAAGPQGGHGQQAPQDMATASLPDAPGRIETAGYHDIAGQVRAADHPASANHREGAPALGAVQDDAIVFSPGYASAGDIIGARGPDTHARTLKQIAVYAAIGNKDGMAMLSSELRARGVSRQAIRDAVSRYNVHGDGLTAPGAGRGNARHVDAGWQASQ